MHTFTKRAMAALLGTGVLLASGVALATPAHPCEVAGEEAVTGDGFLDPSWQCDGTQWQPDKICQWQGVCLYL